MKFPGKRKSKHYFPVSDVGRVPFEVDFAKKENVYIVGVDQLIVDIEAKVDTEFLDKYEIMKGESCVVDEEKINTIYDELKELDLIKGEFAGGTIGNTLHNFSVLSEERSVLLGAISENISVGDYAFHYICNTSSKVDMNHLQPCKGKMARAICLISEDGERSFLIGKGIMNELHEDYIPENVIANSSALVITLYLLMDDKAPIYQATMKACEYAKKNNVPIVLTLGTSFLVKNLREELIEFLKEYVNVIAMNETEAEALTGHDDLLLACEETLNYVDLILATEGPKGIYMAGFTEESLARETKDYLHSKSIAEYNMFEYSRAMLHKKCENPIKVYTHINPFMGGPGKQIINTNGAGDSALAAVLHDMAANSYHKKIVPNSPKHNGSFLSYSSLHQMTKYANRVAYEVLTQDSPRLFSGLPSKEQSLEDAYWEL